MMVEDESGTMALLGRPKKLRTGVLTCLSGFIEQVCPPPPRASLPLLLPHPRKCHTSPCSMRTA